MAKNEEGLFGAAGEDSCFVAGNRKVLVVPGLACGGLEPNYGLGIDFWEVIFFGYDRVEEELFEGAETDNYAVVFDNKGVGEFPETSDEIFGDIGYAVVEVGSSSLGIFAFVVQAIGRIS